MSDNIEEDFISDGFKKLDPGVLVPKPPKIRWGEKYKSWDDVVKIQYLEKFAHSMNHAAYLMQLERDKFGKLCEVKEKQLIMLSRSSVVKDETLLQQITKMNEQKEVYNKEMSSLKKQVRDLENDLLS